MASDSTRRNVPWRNGFLSKLKNTLVLYIFVISNDFPVKRAILLEFLDKSKNAKINFQLS